MGRLLDCIRLSLLAKSPQERAINAKLSVRKDLRSYRVVISSEKSPSYLGISSEAYNRQEG